MNRVLNQHLELLLVEGRDHAVAREAAAFDAAAGPCAESLVLFGVGELGRRTLKGLRRVGIEPLAFSDNTPSLWSHPIEGIEVLPPPEAARRYGQQAAFVVATWRSGGNHRFDRIQDQLEQLGCDCVLPAPLLFWKYPQVFLDYYCLGLPHKVIEERDAVLRAFAGFTDDASRREFVTQVRWRLWADFAGLASPGPHERYFPDDLFALNGDEVIVDCGALDGDSIEAFVRRLGSKFDRIVALEPDPANFRKMSERVAQYPDEVRRKIQLEPLGAAKARGTRRIDAEGGHSSTGHSHGGAPIRTVALDDLLEGTTPTYIKMDIEGAAPDALHGAGRAIRAAAPLLAVSVHHQPNHLWRVPELIKSLRPDYHLFLRPHNEECWNTLCYAVPAHRLNPTHQETHGLPANLTPA